MAGRPSPAPAGGWGRVRACRARTRPRRSGAVARPRPPTSRPPARSARGYPPSMPFYQRLGDLPRKRHVVHRDNGTLLTEEVMGFEGFSGLESILYHLQSPCRVIELGEFEPIVRTEWVPDAHAHRHLRTWNVPPAGDAVTGRQLLMWNNDVEISLCRPTEPMEGFFRNGERDEVVIVHEGGRGLETGYR